MSLQRKWMVVVAILLTAVVAAALGCGKSPAGSGSVEGLVVNVIDVGQGDAVLIRTSGKVTLIDAGDVSARDKLTAFIKGQGITIIDNLIITHPHSDHIGGVAAVLDRFAVRQVYDSGQTTTSPLYRDVLASIQKKGIPFSVLAAGAQLDIGGGAVLNIFAPGSPLISGTESDLNNNSVVAKLIYGKFSLLLPGDSGQEAEERIVSRSANDLRSLVLKSGHHGSRTSSSRPFLKAVSPEAVIISDGLNNEYHHPHPSTLKKYSELGIKVYRTDTDGTVSVISDGESYHIIGERQ